ncbi:MAG: hypothetical protein PHY12_08245 [Eubacteriales bacterium]|nr:hypothetical protein [Eubacteriales bacterium]
MVKTLTVLQIADLVFMLLSLYFHNDWLLITAAAIMTVCVVLTFRTPQGKQKLR